MYNVWCEVKKSNIILIVIGMIVVIMDFYMNGKCDYYFLIIVLLLIAYLVKCILKYLSLKKHGILIENVSYEFKEIKNNEKVLVVSHKLDDGNYIQLFKKKKNWENVSKIGTTKLLINPSNVKQYFIFDPTDIKE